jgi:hypothetical protein
MIAHVVLFTPKTDLADADREDFANAIRDAHRQIPQIRRFAVGRRIRNGRPYEAAARDFHFFALLEFDTPADLEAYLSHPAHDRLAQGFYQTSAAAEAYDFAAEDVPGGLESLV